MKIKIDINIELNDSNIVLDFDQGRELYNELKKLYDQDCTTNNNKPIISKAADSMLDNTPFSIDHAINALNTFRKDSDTEYDSSVVDAKNKAKNSSRCCS